MKHLLLRDYQGQDISGWLMSEKLDGWRAFWTGSEFVTREGNILNAPDWFKRLIPNCLLDGELFAGRGEFNSIQGRMRDGWHGLTFQIFDAPQLDYPFRKRAEWLDKVLRWTLPTHCVVVDHIRCRDTAHLIEHSNAVCDAGGEGSVVRDPRAMYEQGRTESVLRWVPQCPGINRRKSA